MSFALNATAPTELYSLSLHDALPIWRAARCVAFLATHESRVWLASLPNCITTEFSGSAHGHTADPENSVVMRSEEHTSELQSRRELVCRLLLEKKKHASLNATTSTRA